MRDFDTQTIEPFALREGDRGLGCFAESSELANFLLESNRDCVLFLDEEGRLLYINQNGQELLGLEYPDQYLRDSWLKLLAEEARETGRSALARARYGQVEFDVFSPALNGMPKWWRISISAISGPTGEPHRYYMVWRDTTEEMLAVRALRRSEEGFRKIFEENPVGMVLASLNFEITKVNNALCGMLGFSEAELLGRDLRELETGEAQLDELERVVKGELSSFQVETRFSTKGGGEVWGQVTTSLIKDGEKHPLYLALMIENVSDRKNSEEQLINYQEQLQRLASELALSEERERRRIATNLHDGIGQTLALARLKLGAMSQAAGPVPAESISGLRELIDQLIVDTRSLTFELSPPVLYELGLVPALEWLARKIEQDHRIPTHFQDDQQPKPLDDKCKVVLFQAVRELLFNVVKHAGASHAQVLVRRDADAMRIIIEDDGKGFDPHLVDRDKMRGFGLFNVRERVEYLGGKMKVRSQPGAGTRITLMAPLNLTH